MRLSKQGRGKKGSVAPMSDDEDTSGVQHLHQSSAYPSRDQSRGVSFTTSRGKIWLILVINLFIITTFIFMSSSRFPSQYGEGVVNDALEQDQPHPGPVNKNSEQTLSLAVTQSAATEEPQVQETSHPGGYTKLTSTDLPEALDKEIELPDVTESETISEVLSDMPGNPSEIPVAPDEHHEQESKPPLPSKTQQADAPAPDVDVDHETISTTTSAGISPEPASSTPFSGQRSPDKGTPSKHAAAESEDAAPAPKFDPRVNIFEWTPPSDSDSAKAARWTSTVKEKVNYIRNFQLGGDVLRALIRQHKDELVALREELFG